MRMLSRLLLAASVAAALTAVGPARARDDYRGGDHRHGVNGGRVAAAVLGGIALGALTSPGYADPVYPTYGYAPPPPVYYAPPPDVYYAPPPAAYYPPPAYYAAPPAYYYGDHRHWERFGSGPIYYR